MTGRALAGVLALALAGCTGGSEILDRPVPPGMSVAKIERAIEIAGAEHRWNIAEAAPGHLVATHPQAPAEPLDIMISGDSYSIRRRPLPADAHPFVPNRWLNTLALDIDAELRTVALRDQ